MDINLEYYKIFYYTAKQKSVTLAAEKLSISQPAVSQAVKHLESDLSCALFVRTSKGVRLTKEGGLLAEYFREGSWLCIVCKNGKGSTSDQGG